MFGVCFWLKLLCCLHSVPLGYENYKQLKGFLADTHGNALVHIWLGSEAWQMGVANERTDLDDIREHCLSVPGLDKVGH